MSGPKITGLGRTRPVAASQSVDGVAVADGVDFDGGGALVDAPSVLDQWKQPVRCATTANITISTALNAGDTIDGVTLAAGDRVLVKDQPTASQNGIYVVGATPARAADMDDDDEVLGAVVFVIAGTTNAGTAWKVTNTAAVDVDTDAINWSAFGGGGGSLTDHTHAATGSGSNGGGATLSPGTLNLPTATSPSQTADGQAVWDSDDNKLTIGDGASRKTLVNEGAVTSSGLTMATARLLGRTTASTGAIEEISVGSGLTLSAGTLSAPGGSSGSLVYLTKQVASSSATLDFTGWYSSAYDVYEIVFSGIIPATNNVALWMRVSTNGGSSYASSSYYWSQVNMSWNGGVGTNTGNNVGQLGVWQDTAGNGMPNSGSGAGFDGTMRLYRPGDATYYKTMSWMGNGRYQANSQHYTINCMGVYAGSTSAVDAFRILCSSGNITSGTVYLYGVKNS